MHYRSSLIVVSCVLAATACTRSTGKVSNPRPTTTAPAIPPPAQARDAVVTLLTGDRQQLVDALSPPLAASLPSGEPKRGGPAEVTLTDWHQQGNFAAATALVHQSGADARLTVGFRQVDGKWRITLAQPVQQ
jgi:hypothetical protein